MGFNLPVLPADLRRMIIEDPSLGRLAATLHLCPSVDPSLESTADSTSMHAAKDVSNVVFDFPALPTELQRMIIEAIIWQPLVLDGDSEETSGQQQQTKIVMLVYSQMVDLRALCWRVVKQYRDDLRSTSIALPNEMHSGILTAMKARREGLRIQITQIDRILQVY